MVRLATNKDLAGIAKVHSLCFPDSYSSYLRKFNNFLGGGNLLEKFYLEYYKDVPELFIVATNESDEVIGFCMGYYMNNDTQTQRFLSTYKLSLLWKTFLLIVSGNKPTWNKVIDRFKHKPTVNDWTIINTKYEHITNDDRGDLLSVCILPEYRGKGYSQQLMEKFLLSMKQQKKICLLSVKTDNIQARRYYERNGFELYRIRGEEGVTYIKALNS